MLLLPYEKFCLKSALSAEQITNRLEENIEPKKLFRPGSFSFMRNKDYEGIIQENKFFINRITNPREAFRPVIEGEITQSDFGSTVQIIMRLNYLFLTFLLGFIALFFIYSKNYSTLLFILFGGYIFILGGFKYESHGSIKFLKEIFEATER